MGRPRQNCREGIANELKARGIEEHLWMNRDGWRLGIG